ncbi:MAG: hypothetical protein HY873_01270 [Chloroflexi bacterium]|nr:hypothetical protein [Chloroflexota bacterium]
MRWVVPAVGGVLIAGAAVVLAVSWSRSGDPATTTCDHDALVATMQKAIAQADRNSADQVSPEMPAGCTADDMTQAMMEVSRSWHVMPNGTMMRAREHSDIETPTPQ